MFGGIWAPEFVGTGQDADFAAPRVAVGVCEVGVMALNGGVISPRVECVISSGVGGVFPFVLGGEASAQPLAERFGAFVFCAVHGISSAFVLYDGGIVGVIGFVEAVAVFFGDKGDEGALSVGDAQSKLKDTGFVFHEGEVWDFNGGILVDAIGAAGDVHGFVLERNVLSGICIVSGIRGYGGNAAVIGSRDGPERRK